MGERELAERAGSRAAAQRVELAAGRPLALGDPPRRVSR